MEGRLEGAVADGRSAFRAKGKYRLSGPCAEASEHGIAPVHSDHPAYAFMRDGDGDGVVCE